MGSENISYMVAFTAGILTFLSPCLVPLIPSFIVYITGVSFGDLKDSEKKSEVRRKAAIHSLLFIAGFSTVFILLGLTATAMGRMLSQYQDIIRIAGGILIIALGLYLLGAFRLGFLDKEKRFNIPVKGATYAGSFLVGVTFAAAWSPCAGPILGSILVLAGTKASVAEGAKLLVAYSLGIGLPFFVTGLSINFFLANFKKFEKIIRVVNIVSGIFLVMVGILLATNYFNVLYRLILSAIER